MRRRAALAAVAAALCVPRQLAAQPAARSVRIGVVSAGALPDVERRIEHVRRFLRESGWPDGMVAFELRAGGNDRARLDAIVKELLALRVDALVTSSTPAALAAKASTNTVPVVFTMVSDPVASGLISNLARPGGNMTGWSNVLPDTSGKLLGVLKDLIPTLSRVAVLFDAENPGKRLDLKEIEREAKGIRVLAIGLGGAQDIVPAFADALRAQAEAVIVLQDGVTFPNRLEIVHLAAKHRIPAAYQLKDYVLAGGLFSYGLDLDGQNQRTAYYIDRILRGARPGDLPVEQPTHFELVLNLRAARALKLAIPNALRLRADRMIE